MIINTCFLTDDGYAMPTCIAITSMLKNKKKDSKYVIYVLSMNVSKANIEKFMLLDRKDFRIKIIPLDDRYKKYDMVGVSASSTAMYKFSIPEILNKIDKVIYLDGDIIVNDDLSELYNYQIGNNYIGAVKDINGIQKRHFNYYLKNDIFYFNSGVMLMNLNKLREDKVAEKLINYRLNGYNELMDQDSLNYVLRNKAYELPFKFNTQTMFTFINKDVSDLKKLVEIDKKCDSYEAIAKDSVILHYSMKGKPWKKSDGFMFDKWLDYYYISPFKDITIEIKNTSKNKKNTIISKYQAIRKNIRRYKFFKKFSRRVK
jgi:lipopolysaccharide biosynthesis glycosyltransferase